MKRVLAMLLSAIMVLTMVPGMAFANTKTVTISGADSPLTYGYTEDQTITLTATQKEFTDTPSYQWQEEKTEDTYEDIAGATGATYKVATGLAAGSYHYKCVVKDGAADETGVTSEAATVTVNPKALEDVMVAFTDAQTNTDATYELKEGKAEPEVTVTDGTATLVKNTDYTVEYTDNTVATETAKATVTVTGKGNYSGVIKKTFKVTEPKVDIADATVTLEVPTEGLVYNGTEQKPAVKEVKLKDDKVLTTKDYEVGEDAYKSNIDKGTASVTVNGKGNYEGSATGSFEITALPVTELSVELEKAEVTYNGDVQVPAIKAVKAGNVTLQEKDYTVSYEKKGDSDNTEIQADAIKDAGEYIVKIALAANGNCTGDATTKAAFKINPAQAKGKVTLTYDDKDALGTLNKDDTVTADITGVAPENNAVTYQWKKDDVDIENATDATYTVAETDTGVLTCEVTFTGNTTGTITSDALEIGKKLLTGEIEITEQGGVLTVSAPTNAGITDADYAIAWYRNGVAIESATGKTYTITKPADLGKTITATITGKGDYTGTLYAAGSTVPAEKPAAPVITATAGDQAVTVNWRKPEENGAPITGYELTVTKEVAADPTTPTTPAVAAEGDGTQTEPATKAENITGSPFEIDADKTEYAVTGLENGTEYTFTMTATNEAGTSDASAAVKATPKVPAKVYTIKYMSDGKAITVKGNPTQYTEGSAAITLKNPTKKGYTFGGWYKNSKFTGTKVTKLSGITGNTTLYAKWIATTYKITYYANKGTLAKGTQKSYKITTATFTLKNPTRKGYTFAGWYTTSKYRTKATKITKGSTGNKVFYAKWTKVTVAKAKTPVLTNLKGKKLRIKYSATSGAKGYQVQYATNKKFSKAKTKTATSRTVTLTKLKKSKTYYVRVRAYKKDSKGYKVYGKWSTVKSKKITK